MACQTTQSFPEVARMSSQHLLASQLIVAFAQIPTEKTIVRVYDFAVGRKKKKEK